MDDLLSVNLSQFTGLILYFHSQVISTTALDTFESFVSGGGGVLAIHSATASFKKIDRYFDILGGKFVGHGPVQRLEITPCSQDNEIFQDKDPFIVKDELYVHELCSDICVHFCSELDGRKVPVVWTHQYEKGRVCYACPGHRCPALRVLPYRNILLQGLHWACGIPTNAPRDKELE